MSTLLELPGTVHASTLIPATGRPFIEGDWVDQRAPLAFTVKDVLTREECDALIRRIEAAGPTAAPITTPEGFVMRPNIRNNTRVIFDDFALAADLFRRLGPAIPPSIAGMQATGANERFRCYRYAPGQRFAPHYDGAYRRDAREQSQLTLIVYLNEDFGGGATNFLDYETSVTPRTGMALLFQHRLLHEGCAVRTGTKYVLRSDVLYRADR